MSPVALNPNTSEDGDWLEAPLQGGASDPLVNQEYVRLATKYTDAGYREGITDGKLSTLQQGFDESFAQSVPLSRTIGCIRGRAAALLAFLTLYPPSSASVEDELRDLISDMSAVRRDQVLPEDEERVQHEREDHLAFELDTNHYREMENLDKALDTLGKEADEEVKKDLKVLEELQKRLQDLEGRIRGWSSDD
ncbi:uncharacterized protein L203_104729 [Cryptococcus depauperatus CBS 7841]|uniref:Protein YAE1 n=1 Tax=Cryptococcus depauperatus CBS 7841 TaxID=1295531 RepID=A0A1E3HER1_9TREE|nr:hypothetical protein L203_06651 [Cryptococcus depauperatus CBS 7841]